MSDATTLNVVITAGDPPTEFKIFSTPTVDTSKGSFTFGPEEAASVLADFAAQGNEGMVDYDHASLGSSADPALAGRAAGWFDIEMRADGLYATNVRWTLPAAEALKRREWRYMSPAFRTKGRKIASLINVALTNIPATKRLTPLMAAGQVINTEAEDINEAVREALEEVGEELRIGPYEDFDACVIDQKSKGHSEESARKICGSMEQQAHPMSKILGALGLPETASVDDAVLLIYELKRK